MVELELGKRPRREVHRSETVREPRMFGTLIGEMREPELADPAQPLKLGGIDQSDKKPALVGVGFEANDVVNGIPVNLFRQLFSPA